VFSISHDPEVIWTSFKMTLMNFIVTSVPHAPFNPNRKRITHFNTEIKKLTTKTLRVWKKLCKAIYKTKQTEYKLQYKVLVKNKKIRNKIKVDICNKEKKLVSTGNLGKFYQYVNSKTSAMSRIGTLRSDPGILVTDTATKAQLLNDQFIESFIHDNGKIPDMPFPYILKFPQSLFLKRVLHTFFTN